MDESLGFRACGLGFMDWGLGLKVLDLRSKPKGPAFRCECSGLFKGAPETGHKSMHIDWAGFQPLPDVQIHPAHHDETYEAGGGVRIRRVWGRGFEFTG